VGIGTVGVGFRQSSVVSRQSSVVSRQSSVVSRQSSVVSRLFNIKDIQVMQNKLLQQKRETIDE
jgi:hypothetical protein